MTKRTKIVCTIGPATSDVATMVKLGMNGMDVARLNFSHGTHEDHARMVKRLREAGRRLGKPFALLQDLQGPKIRVGELPKEGIRLVRGAEAVFSTEARPAAGDIPVTLPTLHQDVRPGERMLFDDGLLAARVKKIVGKRITTEVEVGGTLLSHKGLNLPGTRLKIAALSDKDRDDARFGVKLGVDYVALSFVRKAEDVLDLRKLLDRSAGGKRIRIIAKIEKPEALENFDKILAVVDGIMVARGDLGIETPAAKVPVEQKEMIDACRAVGKPVIVATQMLDSMQRNPIPTRAEVSDVANAVADHADAVMLSGETASGNYPVPAVKIMSETIRSMEASSFDDVPTIRLTELDDEARITAGSVRLLADALNHPPVAVFSRDGGLVRQVSSFRSETPLVALVADEHEARLMRLTWGVEAAFAVGPRPPSSARVKALLKKTFRANGAKRFIYVVEEPGRRTIEVVG